MSLSVKFSLQLQSPIACSVEDCHYQEQLVIPGSMIRGSLASLYLSTLGKDELFDEIFLSGENSFPFLFPADKQGKIIQRAPHTTMACKRENVSHLEGLHSALGQMLSPPTGTEEHEFCPHCQQDLKSFNGYLCSKDSLPLQRSYMAHTAIEGKTLTAKPHSFFREFLLAPIDPQQPVHLIGYGKLEQDSLEMLQQICDENILLLGRSRSRGKGWAKLSLQTEEPSMARNSFQDDYFTLHCISPIILVDEFLNPSLEPKLRWEGEELLPYQAELTTSSIRGWSVVHGLPKVEDTAIEMGSVFVFAKPPALRSPEAFQQFIEQIETQGIGERKSEGFGQVRINDTVVSTPKEIVTC